MSILLSIPARVLTEEELLALNGRIFTAGLPDDLVYDLSAALAELQRIRDPRAIVRDEPPRL